MEKHRSMPMTTFPIHPDSMNNPMIPGAMPGAAVTASANILNPPYKDKFK
jgi:hypothetical protein